MSENLHKIVTWLSGVSDLCAHSSCGAPGKDRIAAIASALEDEFSGDAFTKTSARHVARAHKFFPAYSEICDTLAEWKRGNIADQLALPNPNGIAHRDQIWIDHYYRELPNKHAPEAVYRLEALVRDMSPVAWNIISPQSQRDRAVAPSDVWEAIGVAESGLKPPAPVFQPPVSVDTIQAKPTIIPRPITMEELAKMRANNPIVQTAIAIRNAS